jgi:hypothetical protein
MRQMKVREIASHLEGVTPDPFIAAIGSGIVQDDDALSEPPAPSQASASLDGASAYNAPRV